MECASHVRAILEIPDLGDIGEELANQLEAAMCEIDRLSATPRCDGDLTFAQVMEMEESE